MGQQWGCSGVAVGLQSCCIVAEVELERDCREALVWLYWVVIRL